MLQILLDVTKGESHEDTRGVLCQSMCEISQIAYESGGDSATSRTGFNPPLIGIQVSDLGTFLTQIIAILNFFWCYKVFMKSFMISNFRYFRVHF